MNYEKWKQMTWRQRASWVFEYYGVWIVSGIVGALVILYLIFSILGGNEEPCGLRILVLDDRITSEKSAALSKELSEQLSEPVEVVGYTSVITEEMQAFSVRLTADGIDVVIAPGNEMGQLQENHYFAQDYSELSRGSRYDNAVYEEAAKLPAEYIGVAAGANNPENALWAVKYLSEVSSKGE